jgi:hypothetical protein
VSAPLTTIRSVARRQDVTVRSGEPVDFTVSVLDALGPVASLAGWSAAAQVRASHADDAELLFEFDVTIEGLLVRVQAAPADTLAWTFRTAPWDLVLTDPDGVRSALLEGWVRHRPTRTR